MSDDVANKIDGTGREYVAWLLMRDILYAEGRMSGNVPWDGNALSREEMLDLYRTCRKAVKTGS